MLDLLVHCFLNDSANVDYARNRLFWLLTKPTPDGQMRLDQTVFLLHLYLSNLAEYFPLLCNQKVLLALCLPKIPKVQPNSCSVSCWRFHEIDLLPARSPHYESSAALSQTSDRYGRRNWFLMVLGWVAWNPGNNILAVHLTTTHRLIGNQLIFKF